MIASLRVVQALEQFVTGGLDAPALNEWIVAAEAGDDLLDSDRDLLSEMRLLLLEYGDGLRALSDVERAASEMLTESGSSISASSANDSPAFLDVNVTPEIPSMSFTQNLVVGAPGP